MVHLDSPLGEELLDIAVRQREAQYQRIERTITSGGKQKPAKADRAREAGRGEFS